MGRVGRDRRVGRTVWLCVSKLYNFRGVGSRAAYSYCAARLLSCHFPGSSRALAGVLCPVFCGVAVVQHCDLGADRCLSRFALLRSSA